MSFIHNNPKFQNCTRLEVTPFLAYNAKRGQLWIIAQVALKKSFIDKWKNEIPPSTSPRWKLIWHKHKAQKGVIFLWSILHKATVANEWHWIATGWWNLNQNLGCVQMM